MSADDPPQVPAPPDDLDGEAERAAWRRGAVAMLELFANNALAVATSIRENGDVDDDGEKTCPECGGETKPAFGGSVCPDCGWKEDDTNGS